MIVNRTTLTRPPTQDQALKIGAPVNEIPRVSLFREMNEWGDFRAVRLQFRDESSQIRQLHLFRRVFQFCDRTNKIHSFDQFSIAQEPGVAAPHRPQPASANESESPDDDPATANTESCFSTFPLLQCMQPACESYRGTIFSNGRPQSLQRYSKIGMIVLPLVC